MKLETFATMRALQSVHSSANSNLLDHFLDSSQGDELRENFKLRRIQFDTHPALSDELESMCNLLNCSKREFLEMAVIDALSKAGKVFFSTYEKEAGHEFGASDPDFKPESEVMSFGVEAVGLPTIVTGEKA